MLGLAQPQNIQKLTSGKFIVHEMALISILISNQMFVDVLVCYFCPFRKYNYQLTLLDIDTLHFFARPNFAFFRDFSEPHS